MVITGAQQTLHGCDETAIFLSEGLLSPPQCAIVTIRLVSPIDHEKALTRPRRHKT